MHTARENNVDVNTTESFAKLKMATIDCSAITSGAKSLGEEAGVSCENQGEQTMVSHPKIARFIPTVPDQVSDAKIQRAKIGPNGGIVHPNIKQSASNASVASLTARSAAQPQSILRQTRTQAQRPIS